MDKVLKNIRKRIRLLVQLCFTAASNGYFTGFAQGKIYTGETKTLCLPGLNCYSCPGSLGSCPLGALQTVLTDRKYSFSFYIAGFFLLAGSVLGRFVCGWLCPFGLIQDLLYRIPFVKKTKNLPGHKILVWFKYVILAVFVILLPLFAADFSGRGLPWFCKYICPAGTLEAGIPLAAANSALQGALGFLFQWKLVILLVTVFLAVVVYRPFCKYICPLGAIYSVFNRISVTGVKVNPSLCVECGACGDICRMDVKIWKDSKALECIQCGDCIRACPCGAISGKLPGMNSEKRSEGVKAPFQ